MGTSKNVATHPVAQLANEDMLRLPPLQMTHRSLSTRTHTFHTTYNGDGQRVKKVVPETGEVTVFVYDAAGKQIAEYSTVVAPQTGAKVNYLTADHLGSPRINTDQSGAVISRHDYHPFGEEISTTPRIGHHEYTGDAIRKQFTGQQRDLETGLDHFNARYYSSIVARFATTDPIVLSEKRVFNPQIWNAYSYAGNNPLRYVDPTGMERIQLGDTEDKIKEDIEKKKAEKKEVDQDQSLSKEERKKKKDEINKQLKTLDKKLEGTRVVNAMLKALDKIGERNNLQLSDFTLTTDPRNDFPGFSQDEINRILGTQAFVVSGDPQYGGTIYIRTDSSKTFYQQYLNLPGSIGMDYLYYGAAAVAHEQYHLKNPRRPHSEAFKRQMNVLINHWC